MSAGILFGGVCLWVCASVDIENYWSEIDVTW